MNKIITEDLDFVLKNINWEKFEKRTVLITGAGGTLLSYITYTLLRINELHPKFKVKIIALVNDKKKVKERFKHFLKQGNLKFLEHNLSSSFKISGKIDYIIHGASYASPCYFKTDPIGVILPNTVGTYYLLELAKAKKVKSFLFFSSGAVYGKPVLNKKIAEKDYGYLDPLDVINCYGESKKMAENMCKCWNYQFEVPVKIVRPAHIYGPTMDIKNDGRVVANFTNNVVNGKNIVIKSDGSAHRCFCYIADATVAFLKVLLEGKDGEAYNVGSADNYISIKKLAEAFVSAVPEKKLKIILKPGKPKKNKEIETFMSFKKMENLGWKCVYPIHRGLKRTILSFSKNIKN